MVTLNPLLLYYKHFPSVSRTGGDVVIYDVYVDTM